MSIVHYAPAQSNSSCVGKRRRGFWILATVFSYLNYKQYFATMIIIDVFHVTENMSPKQTVKMK